MKKTSKITLPNGIEIIAERYDYDENHPEIAVYLAKDGQPYQDLCMVRPNEENKENVEVLVWSDKYDEDYTHRFIIEQYEGEEEDKEE